MINENKILQVIAEQKEYIQTINTCKWVKRKEENLFELDSTLAQVVIGVRRSGKSTICHKVLLENNIKYGYVNLDDDRLTNIHTEDLNLVLSCIYQIYGTDIQYLFLDEIQNVENFEEVINAYREEDEYSRTCYKNLGQKGQRIFRQRKGGRIRLRQRRKFEIDKAKGYHKTSACRLGGIENFGRARQRTKCGRPFGRKLASRKSSVAKFITRIYQ